MPRYQECRLLAKQSSCRRSRLSKPDQGIAMTNRPDQSNETLQKDDRLREEQRSHRDQQNRSKKDGHTSQIGTGQAQNSQRNRGQGARRP